jgi:hypothetical protein
MEPKTNLPPHLQSKLSQAFELLATLPVEDQLEVSCHLVGAALKAVRPQFARYPDSRAVYNELCDLAGSWVELEIVPLRFDRSPLAAQVEPG